MMLSVKPCESQLEKAKRWKERIKNVLDDYSEGKVTEPSLILFDMIHSFFCECHHIKEYIINDKSLKINSKIINDFIGKNDCLKICADICNGKKHLKLRDGGWTGKKPEFHMNIEFKEDKNDIYVEFQSKLGDKEFFALADECIKKWEKFIKNNVK